MINGSFEVAPLVVESQISQVRELQTLYRTGMITQR